MYVAVKGGERAIEAAHKLSSEERRGPDTQPELTVDQISSQLTLAVDRVMTEGSLYDRELAALAIKQARGDLIEAIFLLRASRTTLARFGYSEPVETSRMTVRRRVSATFKDVPGGQILGPTFDYQHRLLDFDLLENSFPEPAETAPAEIQQGTPRVLDLLGAEGLIEPASSDDDRAETQDLTSDPLEFPASRDVRLQNLARGDEGFLLSLGYSTQRGYARNHAFAGEIRLGEVVVEFEPKELGFAIEIGEITVSECEMVNQFKGSKKVPPQFTRGYGLAFGHCERKVMAMALVDRALRADELGEDRVAPAQDEEVRAVSFGQCAGHRLRGASEIASLCGLSVRVGACAQDAGRTRRAAGGRGMTAATKTAAQAKGYNFAYLNEQTKRMIRRAILKAVAIPGYQVPFASREMPMPYGWGTGGVQVTAAILTPEDRLKVIDQGADDTTNAVSIRKFFVKTAGVPTTTRTSDATIIQTRHRIPEQNLREDQILVYQVPIPEPLRFLEPRETETRKMHASGSTG